MGWGVAVGKAVAAGRGAAVAGAGVVGIGVSAGVLVCTADRGDIVGCSAWTVAIAALTVAAMSDFGVGAWTGVGSGRVVQAPDSRMAAIARTAAMAQIAALVRWVRQRIIPPS